MMHHYHQLPRVSKEQEAAFAELYQRHASAIFSYLCQHTKTYEDAEDLLLEVFSSVLEEEAFFERSTAQQSGWLWRVARNKRIDAYRREQRRPALVLDLVTDSLYEDEKHEPEHIALRREEYRQLQEALAQLSPLQQEVLRLRFAKELRCSEMARELGKSEGAVRVLLLRTLKFLRTIYEKHR
jgi:RNA polymerase sigma-70 factor (ECF subfamily)